MRNRLALNHLLCCIDCLAAGSSPMQLIAVYFLEYHKTKYQIFSFHKTHKPYDKWNDEHIIYLSVSLFFLFTCSWCRRIRTSEIGEAFLSRCWSLLLYWRLSLHLWWVILTIIYTEWSHVRSTRIARKPQSNWYQLNNIRHHTKWRFAVSRWNSFSRAHSNINIIYFRFFSLHFQK